MVDASVKNEDDKRRYARQLDGEQAQQFINMVEWLKAHHVADVLEEHDEDLDWSDEAREQRLVVVQWLRDMEDVKKSIMEARHD
jgi:uncharacterized protein YifN (PemK superfamily)